MKNRKSPAANVYIVSEMVRHHYLMTEEVYEKYKKASAKQRKRLPLLEIDEEKRQKIMKKFKHTEL